MKKQIIVIGCFISLFSFGQKTSVDRFAGVDKQFQQLLKDWHEAGFAVAVVEKDKVIYSKGFGYRDYEKKLPVTPNTLFPIGSVTKAFTASLIGLLQKEGKVDLNKPAFVYLPQLAFFNDAMNQNINLRHMMSHQTGLPRHDISWYFFNTSSRDSVLQRVKYQEPTAGVREKYQYNNFMFTAQGAIVEKITGKSWEDNIEEKIFRPLSMTRSTTTIADMLKRDDVAVGYKVKRDSIISLMNYYNINAMNPAGSINSSVSEMTNWLITWINGGKFRGTEILPAQYVTEAISPQAISGPGLPDKEKPDIHLPTYGFGWSLLSYRGHYRVEHGGNIDGFSASAAFFPTDSIGIIVLSNQNQSSIPAIIRNTIADRLFGLKPYNWSAYMKKTAEKSKAAAREAAKARQKKIVNSRPPLPFKEYDGTYFHPGYGNLHVAVFNDSLFARAGQYRFWLRHSNFDVFEPFMVDEREGIDTSGGSQFPIQFRLNVAGEVESLTVPFQTGLSPLEFKKQPVTIAIAQDELKKYEGEFELSKMTPKFYIKGTTLYLFVPGQPEYELSLTGKDKFSFKAMSGFHVQFEVNDKGEVTGATLIQPNGNFKAVKK